MPIQVSDIIEPTGSFPVIDATDLRGGFRSVASSVPGGGTPAVEAQLTALVGGVNNLSQGMLAFDTRTSTFYQLGADSQWSEVRLVGGTIASIDGLQTTLDGLRTDVDAKAPASHTHPVANLQAGSAELGDVVKFDGTNWVAGAITVSGDTYDSQAFNDAVERELLVNLPTSGGVLDIAQESTLLDLGNDIDGIDTRVTALENAPDGVDLGEFADGALLKVDASSGSGNETLAEAVAGTDYIAPSDITKLRAVFPEADLPASAGTTTGYWKWTYADGSGTWAIDTNQVTAPDEINGGNATSFGA